MVLTIPTADGALPRIDRIVLRFDAAAGKSELVVLKGTPASSPAAPAVSRTELVYDLGLYTVNVPAGSLAVSAADISSTMTDENVCGLMRDGVTEKSLEEAIPDGIITTEKFAPDAEAPFAGNGVHQLDHQKVGTVHQLSGFGGRAGIVSVVFKASAAFAEGDTFTIDGVTYAARMPDGEAVADGAFTAGAAVGAVIDTAGKTVNFKGGGGVRLPALTKPAGAAQITKGYQAINAQGKIVTGTAEKYTVKEGSVSISDLSSATISYTGTLVSALVWVTYENRDEEERTLSCGVTEVGQDRSATDRYYSTDNFNMYAETAGKIRVYNGIGVTGTFYYTIITK